MKKPIELNKIKEACDEYLYHIAIRASRGAREKNKIVADYYEKAIIEVSKCISGVSYPEDMTNLRVRIITPDNKFTYTRFGCFFFFRDCMYLITEDIEYAKFHNADIHMMDERLKVLNDSTTYTVRVEFAGISTGVKDIHKDYIYTEDVVKALHSFKQPVNEEDVKYGSKVRGRITVGFCNDFVVMLDNHSVNLNNCYNIERIGTRQPEYLSNNTIYFNNYKSEKEMKLTINELLKLRGITEKDKVKFIRHKFSDSKDGVDFYDPEIGRDVKLESFVTIEDFYRNRNNDFKKYQNTQLTSNFKGVNYIVSFIAESGTRARFVGVYKLEGKPIELRETPKGKLKSYYNFVETDILSDLKERMIINWGESTISWHQWLQDTNKEKEILMIGDPLGDLPFPGYMDFTLTRQELERVFEFEYKEWKNALMAVNCIYLITDNNTGKHYVGSTYNTEGVWGRWGCYATTIHGNNKELIKLIKQGGENYRYNLQYTILQILPLNISPKEAIHREEIYKNKLGTKVHGLNLINQKKSN